LGPELKKVEGGGPPTGPPAIRERLTAQQKRPRLRVAGGRQITADGIGPGPVWCGRKEEEKPDRGNLANMPGPGSKPSKRPKKKKGGHTRNENQTSRPVGHNPQERTFFCKTRGGGVKKKKTSSCPKSRGKGVKRQ